MVHSCIYDGFMYNCMVFDCMNVFTCMYAMASLSFFLHESCARKKDKKTKYNLIQLIVPLEVLLPRVVVLLYWPLITVSSLQ